MSERDKDGCFGSIIGFKIALIQKKNEGGSHEVRRPDSWDK